MIIKLSDFEVVFNSGNDALKVLDIPHWSIKEGDRVAIWGPSGCGKSTLLYTLAGLMPATNGSISVCDHELNSMSEVQRDSFRARYVGFIFQNFNLLHGFTALENVLVGMTFSPRKPDVAEAEHLLHEVGLSHRLTYLPSRLSAGEQQRVAVARALANRPRLLLADEPTASLHPVNKKDVLRLLLNMCDRHGCTLLIVTHEREVISLFNNTVKFLELNRAFDSQSEG